jgi:hypothetical protein
VTCPAGESSCIGTVALRTLKAVSVADDRKLSENSSDRATAHPKGKSRSFRPLFKSKKKKSKAAVLQLASGTFTAAGGQVATVTLRLSAKARALLEHTHMLVAQATISAHDPVGATYVSQAPVEIRTSKAKGRRKR